VIITTRCLGKQFILKYIIFKNSIYTKAKRFKNFIFLKYSHNFHYLISRKVYYFKVKDDWKSVYNKFLAQSLSSICYYYEQLPRNYVKPHLTNMRNTIMREDDILSSIWSIFQILLLLSNFVQVPEKSLIHSFVSESTS